MLKIFLGKIKVFHLVILKMIEPLFIFTAADDKTYGVPGHSHGHGEDHDGDDHDGDDHDGDEHGEEESVQIDCEHRLWLD